MGPVQSEKWFRAIAEATLDIVFIVEADGSVAYVNPVAAAWIGKSPEQIIGSRQGDLFMPSTVTRQMAAIRQVFETGQSSSTQDISEVGGLRRFLDTRLIPLRDENGTVNAVLGFARDVTQERAISENLRKSEERFRALIEHSDEVIVINDATNKRLFVSPSVERILGYSVQEYLAQTVTDIIHPDDVAALQEVNTRSDANPRTPFRITFRIRHKNGEWRWIDATLTNLFELPAIRGRVINLHDITDLRRAQEAEARAAELERIANIMTGRELKMAELKEEIERLKTEKGA
ncbi:MAG TPA: PAS domain S-box protein [Candidatus Paceibacterota bacterium]|nr:PAS domain S-box protein [Candidatus Paceibacterota bacterium]